MVKCQYFDELIPRGDPLTGALGVSQPRLALRDEVRKLRSDGDKVQQGRQVGLEGKVVRSVASSLEDEHDQ
jgi:hypothetical protein